jgi:hypothetical protein
MKAQLHIFLSLEIQMKINGQVNEDSALVTRERAAGTQCSRDHIMRL